MSRQPGITLGTSGMFFFKRPIRLPVSQATTHYHVIGVSGSGKSRFLVGLYQEFLEAGVAATYLDPHGDAARHLLAALVEKGFYGHPGASGSDRSPFERLLFLDIPAAERAGLYLPLNVLRSTGAPDAIAAQVMEAMHRAWPALANGAAPRFDSFIQYGVPVLVANELPLPALPRLIADKPYRDACLESVADVDIREFWQGWYDRLSDRLRLEYVDSTLSRIRLLTRAPVLRYSLSQPANVLAWRTLFDSGRSAVINLALPNSDAQRLLGCLLMVGAEQGAISRAERAPEERGRAHMMVVDEFPEFTARSEAAAARMLSQTRKYGLHLILAHQNWTQTSDRLRGALQNVGAEVSFALGREDAERSAKLVSRVDPSRIKHDAQTDTQHPVYDPLQEQWEKVTQYLVDQTTGNAVVKLPGDRQHKWEFWKSRIARSLPIKAMQVPDPQVSQDVLAQIEREYLQRYFVPVESLTAALAAQAAPGPSSAPLSRSG